MVKIKEDILVMESIMRYMNVELRLEVVNKNGEKVGPSYTTEITQVNAIDDIDILAPTFDKYTIPLPIDTEIKIILQTASTGDIFLHGMVISKFNTENGTLLKIKLNNPKDKKSSNAPALKIDCNLKAEYLETNLVDNEEFNKSKVIKISEQGLTLLVNKDINLHELIDIYIWISNRKITNAVCNAIQKNPWTNTNEYKYQVDLSFTEISDSAKDSIIRYIFEEQKEYLKKRGIIKKSLNSP